MSKLVDLIKVSPTAIAVTGLVVIGVTGIFMKSESVVTAAVGGLSGLASPAGSRREKDE